MTGSARAIAGPNIALIKYWGNRGEPALRLAANGSISITLDSLWTEVQLTFDDSLPADSLQINGEVADAPRLERTRAFLGAVRRLADLQSFACVESRTNFPMGAGIASSAAAFAALAMAATHAAGLRLELPVLSRLARLGSGSACRSVFAGYVEWIAGEAHETSQAEALFPPGHWDLVDLIVLIDEVHKPVGSTEGHALASTSALQPARLADAPRRLAACRQAIRSRDFPALASIVELDSNMMHAVMLTSSPPLVYWRPATLSVMGQVVRMRQEGAAVCYTIDAGPTVHCLCEPAHADEVASALATLDGVRRVLRARPGDGARLVEAAQ